MAINFNRPADTQLSSAQLSKMADTGKKASSAEEAPAQSPNPSRADSVQLSSSALQMQNLAEQLASTPDVINVEKVEQIRQAIEAGTYSIDSREVADKMLDFEARFD